MKVGAKLLSFVCECEGVCVFMDVSVFDIWWEGGVINSGAKENKMNVNLARKFHRFLPTLIYYSQVPNNSEN